MPTKPLTTSDREPEPGDVLTWGPTDFDRATVIDPPTDYPVPVPDALFWYRGQKCWWGAEVFAVRAGCAWFYRYVSWANGRETTKEVEECRQTA